jgi:Uma2 family endonuclease
MATTQAPSISVEDYLKSSEWKPDVNYIDGEIEERHMGNREHAAWQSAIQHWFLLHQDQWKICNLPEYRVQVKAASYLVPDVTITAADAPREEVAITPPLAVFEMWSEKSSVRKLLRNLKLYQAMGVPQIWFIDPADNIWQRFVDGQLIDPIAFELPDRGMEFDMNEINKLVR